METQLRMVSKEEAHRLIDNFPGNKIMILTYNRKVGISDMGRYVKKKKGRILVDKASVLVVAENNPILTLNLHNKYFSDFSCYNREKIDKSIMLSKLEWFYKQMFEKSIDMN